MVALGAWRERGNRACQVCVSPNRLFVAPFSLLPAVSRALRSYEHGVTTFDVADTYSNGVSEIYLGRAIKALNLPREGIVVMTKVMWSTRPR